MTDTLTTFAKQLDEAHQWPCSYTFKFIVPNGRADEVRQLFGPEAAIRETASRTGKYISVTAEAIMDSSEQVIALYKQAATIEGIISL